MGFLVTVLLLCVPALGWAWPGAMLGMGSSAGVVVPPEPNFAVVQQALNTGTGTQDFTASRTWTPGAALFLVTRSTSIGSGVDQGALGVGCTDGTRQFTQSLHSLDGNATADSSVWAANDALIQLVDTSSNAIDFEAAFSAFSTGTLTINITNAPASAYIATAILFDAAFSLRCDSFTTNATQNATTDITTVGFQPDTVFVFGRDDAVDDANHTPYEWCWGIADSGSAQASIAQGHVSGGAADGDVSGYVSTSIACHTVTATATGGSNRVGVELGSFDAQGFTATTRNAATAREFIYLAAAWGGKSHWAGVRTTPTAIGSESVTSPGFKPQFGMLWGSHMSAINSLTADATAEILSLGAFLSATEGAHQSLRVADAAATTRSVSGSSGHALKFFTTAVTPATYVDAEWASWDSTGYTLQWNTVDTTGRRLIVFVVGE
jgi:hypothetical protein